MILIKKANGAERYVEEGQAYVLAPDEKVIPDPNWQNESTYVFRKCSNCGDNGVFEYT